jgi:hypothetical protein
MRTKTVQRKLKKERSEKKNGDLACEKKWRKSEARKKKTVQRKYSRIDAKYNLKMTMLGRALWMVDTNSDTAKYSKISSRYGHTKV